MNLNKNKALMLGVIVTPLIVATAVVSRSLVSASASPKTSPVVVVQSQNATQDEQQITKVAMGHLSKGNSSTAPPVTIDAITIVRPYATVDWFWGEMAGQALLLKKQAAWQVVLVDGGAFTSSYLIEQGVPSDIAQALVRNHEEQSLKKGKKMITKV